ncbi:MAG: type III-A CRISPR-associated protein Csm2 [Campylobacteraceae bacterium]|jgi:CRISPR-associated protein Csm2|nr:type III-A CRISPR-associated protein Csm2 [Campylobacteraceae bacterium]
MSGGGKYEYGKNKQSGLGFTIDFERKVLLFDKVAQDCAKAINGTKSTQARNFYDYVLKLLDRVDNGEKFDNILPFVKMLNSKVHYAKARGHVSDEFIDMIKQCVNKVDNEETLRTFKLFFEAVIGFSKR